LYFDLSVTDVSRARAFFEAVLEWRFEEFEMPYAYYRVTCGTVAEPGIDGGIGSVRDAPLTGGQPLTVLTMNVSDLDTVLRQALAGDRSSFSSLFRGQAAPAATAG
jgi:predicted enzyme related to lactoylglutathione lyase